MSGTIAETEKCKILHIMKFENLKKQHFQTSDFKVIMAFELSDLRTNGPSPPDIVKGNLIVGVLTPLSAIFQLYHGDQF